METPVQLPTGHTELAPFSESPHYLAALQGNSRLITENFVRWGTAKFKIASSTCDIDTRNQTRKGRTFQGVRHFRESKFAVSKVFTRSGKCRKSAAHRLPAPPDFRRSTQRYITEIYCRSGLENTIWMLWEIFPSSLDPTDTRDDFGRGVSGKLNVIWGSPFFFT